MHLTELEREIKEDYEQTIERNFKKREKKELGQEASEIKKLNSLRNFYLLKLSIYISMPIVTLYTVLFFNSLINSRKNIMYFLHIGFPLKGKLLSYCGGGVMLFISIISILLSMSTYRAVSQLNNKYFKIDNHEESKITILKRVLRCHFCDSEEKRNEMLYDFKKFYESNKTRTENKINTWILIVILLVSATLILIFPTKASSVTFLSFMISLFTTFKTVTLDDRISTLYDHINKEKNNSYVQTMADIIANLENIRDEKYINEFPKRKQGEVKKKKISWFDVAYIFALLISFLINPAYVLIVVIFGVAAVVFASWSLKNEIRKTLN